MDVSNHHITYTKGWQFTLRMEGRYPTSDAGGIYVQEFTYTPAGEVKAVRYLDIGGQPCPRKDGAAEARRTFPGRGNKTEEFYFDAGGKTSHADHIEPVNRFANLEMANSLDNIQTLCHWRRKLKTARKVRA